MKTSSATAHASQPKCAIKSGSLASTSSKVLTMDIQYLMHEDYVSGVCYDIKSLYRGVRLYLRGVCNTVLLLYGDSISQCISENIIQGPISKYRPSCQV